MTINDLKSALINVYCPQMQHVNNKTVRFYPLSIDEDSNHHVLHGYWIAIDSGEPIVSETIKIKKEDLQNWYIVE